LSVSFYAFGIYALKSFEKNVDKIDPSRLLLVNDAVDIGFRKKTNILNKI